MKKLITSLFLVLLAFSMSAQTAWNKFYVTAVAGTGKYSQGADTMYVGIQCRNGAYDFMVGKIDGSLVGGLSTNYAAFAAADSSVWRVVKGTAVGSKQRVRFINVKTGKYIYQGKKGGTTLVPYVDNFNSAYSDGLKDFYLNEQGTDSKGTFYYYITGADNNEFYNGSSATSSPRVITVKSAYQGWKFVPKQGPKPKPTYANYPKVTLTTTETSFNAGGTATLNASISNTCANYSKALLYHGTTLIDTLRLDANGQASGSYTGLTFGSESFSVVYAGDSTYCPADTTISINVLEALTAKATVLNLTLPTTSEVHKDVTLSVAATTTTGDIVTSGSVVVYINGVAKNRLTLDVLGNASLNLPNLIPGTIDFKAVYIGDRVSYLNSDTVRTSITVNTPSTPVYAYPVYFDLCSQPVIRDWQRKYSITNTNYSTYIHSFVADSIKPFITTELSAAAKYSPCATTSAPAATDSYFHADYLLIPLGSSRSKWINFQTPWLNKGSYNVYVSNRNNTTGSHVDIDSVTMDKKDLYYANEEMYGRWLKSYDGTNTNKRWSTAGYNNNIPMMYLGSVTLDKSDVHDLRIRVKDANGTDIWFDMLQFIPVDQDSVTITKSAAVAFAKVQYPLFDYGGYARLSGETALTTFSNLTEMALPYQVTDPMVYSKKTSHVIDSLVVSTEDQFVSGTDIVTIYRKDQWTRMADLLTLDISNPENATVTYDLPDGDYYYEETHYIENSNIVGSIGTRVLLKSGTFTVGAVTAVNTPAKTSSVYAYTRDRVVTLMNINAGDKIAITDITGKVVAVKTSTDNTFSLKLNPSIYIVKVISAKTGTSVAKVIVK